MKPVDIAHSTSRNELAVTWDDGTVSTLPVPYLRSWCPCAGCQGHGNEVKYLNAPDDTTIDGLFEIGAYALGIRYQDGHDAGIYTWEWLQKISPQSHPTGFKHGRFEGGVYQP
jgi:DUF971 family protein